MMQSGTKLIGKAVLAGCGEVMISAGEQETMYST